MCSEHCDSHFFMPSSQGRWRVETFKVQTHNRKKGIHLMFSTFCFVVLLPVHFISRHDAAFGQKISHTPPQAYNAVASQSVTIFQPTEVPTERRDVGIRRRATCRFGRNIRCAIWLLSHEMILPEMNPLRQVTTIIATNAAIINLLSNLGNTVART